MSIAPLLLAAIVRNAVHKIGPMVRSAHQLVERCLVLDTGSTDGTRAAARDAGATVEEFVWVDDFSSARNRSLELAAELGAAWVLVLDADEVLSMGEEVTERLRDAIRQELQSSSADAYILRVVDVDWGRPVSSWGAYPSVRLFRCAPERIRYKWRVHNLLHDVASGDPLTGLQPMAPLTILHSGYSGELIPGKNAQRRRLLELELEADPSRGAIHYYMARLLYQEQDLAGARQCADAALALAQCDSPAMRSLYLPALSKLQRCLHG